MTRSNDATPANNSPCLACQRQLPKQILVTFFDPQTKRSAGRTMNHEAWVCLKLQRAGGMEN
jgi:hypothetical protein